MDIAPNGGTPDIGVDAAPQTFKNQTAQSDDEFDEAWRVAPPELDPETGPKTKTESWPRRLSRKSSLRLILGAPIVWGLLVAYGGIIGAAIGGGITSATARDLVALLAVPGTLAGTVIGFLFREGANKKDN